VSVKVKDIHLFSYRTAKPENRELIVITSIDGGAIVGLIRLHHRRH
jgi:hypothetical protein